MAEEGMDNNTGAGDATNAGAGDNNSQNNAGNEGNNAEQNADKLILQDIEKKQAELKEAEERIDKKTKALEAMVKEAGMAGKAAAGKAAAESEEDEKKKAAMKLIEGTGFEKRLAL